MSKWYISTGNNGDVIMSTRVRLARNIREYPFPVRLDASAKRQVSEKVRDALLGSNAAIVKDFDYIDMEQLSEAQAVSLAERHIISPEFTSARAGRALLLSKDEAVSIMLCEEDHIRLQVMQAGLSLESAYDLADKLDTLLDHELHFAFDEQLGYLTQCPTNLGTGMRASVMLHLPALTRCGQINRLAGTVSKLGLTIRGSFGEGSGAKGDFYQLSNQVTLGISEQAAIENLQSIAMQIVAQERALRKDFVKSEMNLDQIYRAYGILKYARQISGAEFMELISLIRLGVAMDLFENGPKMETVNELIAGLQPATLNVAAGEKLPADQRDILRAGKVREAI